MERSILYLLSCCLFLGHNLFGQTTRSEDSPALAMATVQANVFTMDHDHWEYEGAVALQTFVSETEMANDRLQESMAEAQIAALLLELEQFEEPEISLIHFDALRQANEVSLDWSAATDESARQFVVQRSEDGEHWSDIGMLQIPDNANLEDYRYVDNHPLKGSNYYRLKQVNQGAAEGFSEALVVEILPEGSHTTQLFPNPMLFGASVEFDLHIISPVEVRIENEQGDNIATIYSKTASAGRHQIDLDLGQLGEGAYTCVIEVNGVSTRRPLKK